MGKSNELFQEMRERGITHPDRIDRMEKRYEEEMALAKRYYTEEAKQKRDAIRHGLNMVFEAFHPMNFIAHDISKEK